MFELNEQTKIKAQELIKARWKKPMSCEVCHGDEWHIGDVMVTSTEMLNSETVNIAGVCTPQIPVVCGGCGNTKSFNAAVLGLLKAGDNVA